MHSSGIKIKFLQNILLEIITEGKSAHFILEKSTVHHPTPHIVIINALQGWRV